MFTYLKNVKKKFTRQKLQQLSHGVVAAILAMMVSIPATYADDTEIFFGKSGSGAESNSNILFLLDTSGSMRETDGTGQSRLARMQSAMGAILDQSSDFNVGLMGLNGTRGGGAILYPVGYLEADTTDNCPAEGCPDQTVIGRTVNIRDDAIEYVSTGRNLFSNPNGLPMGLASPEANTPRAEGEVTTVTVDASASVLETTRIFDDVTVHRENEASDLWFYWGTGDDHDLSRYAYRFDNVELPPGASVTDAKITFVYDNTAQQQGDVSAYISAESSAVPAPYPDAATVPTPDPNLLLNERLTTSNFIPWRDIPLGIGGESIDTPDLSALLQELISLPGWTSGNSMSIHIDPFDEVDASFDTARQFYGVTAISERVPKLTFSYTTTTDNSTASGISTQTATEHVLEHFNPNTLITESNSTGDSLPLFTLDDQHEQGVLGLRFDDLAIPENADITSAILRLNVVNSDPIAGPGGNGPGGNGPGGNGPGGNDPAVSLPTFDMVVNAALSHQPSPFGSTYLQDRDYSVNFVNWLDVPAVTNEVVDSPDLRDLIQDVVALPDWDENGSLLLTLNPGSMLGDGLQRLIETSLGTIKPELEISWIAGDDGVEVLDENVITGLRFNFLHIPPGATITSAFIRVNSESASNEDSSLTIAAELTGHSDAFDVADFNISSRPQTFATETWNVGGWPQVQAPYESVDVKRLVQEVVDHTDWCGGNAMTMLISGTGHRNIISQDQNDLDAARLYVTYDPNTVADGSYCSNGTFVAGVNAKNNDAYETTTNATNINSVTIPLADRVGAQIGLRFPDIAIPRNTAVRSASLQLTAASQIDTGTSFKIEIENSDNASSYVKSSGNISNRSYLAESVSWNGIPATGSGEVLFSSDIMPLVSAVVNRGGWTERNAMAFRLTQTGGGEVATFHSRNGEPALSARLVIYFESTRDTPGTLVRDDLKTIVDNIVAAGSTPLTGALYEASRYFEAQSVEFGKQRGVNPRHHEARYRRVSHPGSYTGADSVSRHENCKDGNLNHEDCEGERILGNPIYETPMQDSCQQNHIVMLSDGLPRASGALDEIRAKVGINTCQLPDNNHAACGVELAQWMQETDLNTALPGKQNITTHTIAFNQDDPQFNKEIASAGGGGAYEASTTSELLNAFKSIFQNVSTANSSFVAPSVAVDQFNRLKHREDILFAQFQPSSTSRWSGNLKKYKISGNEGEAITIVDANGDPAIDENTAEFRNSSVSYWSNTTDGNTVTRGGAASRLNLQARKIYTLTDDNKTLSDFENRVDVANTELNIGLFNLPPDLLGDTEYQDALINWTAGLDSLDADSDGDTNDYRQHMGDLMHSQPIVVDYKDGNSTQSIIFAGTNEGYLHAIDNMTGLEQFAFIPPEHLADMRLFFDNQRQGSKTYGIDGPISTWLSDENQNGSIDPGETALLYFGMRRGGRNYYALDISDIDSPKIAYIIRGGSNANNDPVAADGDYTELSQTWSRINKTKVRDGDEIIDVIVFAGGYDPNQDPGDTTGTENPTTGDFGVDGTRRTDGNGRAIFIADARTGKLLWKTSLADPTFSDMLYSIPSDIRMIDVNADGMTDQMYFGDMGGQVWRMDINNGNETSDQLDDRITAGVIAELGGDDSEDALRFYYPPDVALVNVNGKLQLSVSIGSGWRAHPLQTYINDRFYSFRIGSVFNAPRDSFGQINYPKVTDTSNDLLDVTDTLDSDMSSYDGWYIRMEDQGEKVLASSVTLDNRVIFTTYTPSTDNDGCAAAVGHGAVYVVDVFNGDPVENSTESSADVDANDLDKSHRKQILKNAGIPTTPTVIFPTTGQASVQVGPESLDEFTLNELKRRSFWQEHVDDNS